MGQQSYPQATELLITADSGGSNGSRVRLWKVELQRLADETGLELRVCHLPPGTSKWNKIEHRLFSFISQNWRGKPLVSHQVIVDLIAATSTKTGLKVRAQIDSNLYLPASRSPINRSPHSTLNAMPSMEWNWAHSVLASQSATIERYGVGSTAMACCTRR